jgi:SAM-dependent methyltransferase
MFGLREADLERSVLDCPGGAASFAAETRRRGGRVVAVDPAYRMPAAELASLVRGEVDRGNRFVGEHGEVFSWRYFASVAEHHQARSHAADRFLADFVRAGATYVAAALPSLPFAGRAFDLVLSSHLLVTYADRLDTEFHLAAIRELVRVGRQEVRIFPLVDTEGRDCPDLDGLRRRLHTGGVRTDVRPVDYEFQRGANEMLVCRRAG